MNDETQLKEAVDYVEDEAFTFEGYQVVRGEFFLTYLNPPSHLITTKSRSILPVLSDYRILTMFKYW